MIRKLQNRFIRIAMVTLTVAMVLVVGVVNIANWVSVRGELFNTLHLLVQAYGPTDSLPDLTDRDTNARRKSSKTQDSSDDPGVIDSGEENMDIPEADWSALPMPPNRFFRNMVKESTWFSATVTETGEIVRLRIVRKENTDEEIAKQVILQAAADGREEGRLQDSIFQKTELPDGRTQVFVLNCETRLASVRKLIWISVIACAGAILLSFLLVKLASRKAVEPTIRNMEQQKQFITNASHELKTPLTVISTNMELLQMETEDNPWVRSTQKQTAVMRHLVDELVYLSRMEEEYPTLEMAPFDPGSLLKETAEPFVGMAEFEGKEMSVNAEEGLQMTGDRASIQRLMSTLCDNAVKYASEGSICAEISGEGKYILLEVSNPVKEPLTKEQCSQLFDRFYRADPSRNKGKQGGFGIGLAIAAAIAEKHDGRIFAEMEENRIVFRCLLPRDIKP